MQPLNPMTLRQNFSWIFVGNVIYAASQWGMLVVLAKLGTPEMVGQFTLGLSVTAPVIMFTNLQLRRIQTTDARQQYSFRDYLGLRLISPCLALVIICIIITLTGYSWDIALPILLVGISKSIESISDVFYGLFQQNERMDRIAISLIIKGPLSLLMLGLATYVSKDIVWSVVGLIIAWAVVLVVYDIRSGALLLNNLREMSRESDAPDRKDAFSLCPRWHPKKLLSLSLLALPMGFVMMLVSLNVNIPRYFIEHNLGVKELGIFAAMSYLMVAGKLVVDALAETADARLAKHYAVGDLVAFRSLLVKLIGISSLLGGMVILIAALVGKDILTLLYGSEYAQHTGVFVLLTIAALVDYLAAILGHGMTAARYFRVQVPLLATVSIISAVSSFLLIPAWGMRGAAFSIIIATAVGSFSSLWVLFHAYRKRLSVIQSQN